MKYNYLSICYVFFLFHEIKKSRKEKPYREKTTDILKQTNNEMYKTDKFDKTDRIRIFVFSETDMASEHRAPKGLFEK